MGRLRLGVHQILQNAKETKTQLKENHLVIDMPNGYQLSGIFDLYDDATGTVTDYKTASAWKAVFGAKDDEELGDWRKQTLIYCWMLRKIGFDAHRGEIVALLKDHKKSDAKNKADYPKHPVWRVGWDFTDEQIEKCGEWLAKRFEEIEAAEKLPDDQLPMCTESERWHRADKWAVMKEGRKSAIRLFDSEDEAKARMEQESANGKGKFYVEHRPGEDPKCMDYCSACQFCDHYRKLTEEA